jgi:competence protein ComEA
LKTKQKVIGSVVILLVLIGFLVVGIIINKPKSHKINEEDIFVDSTPRETSQITDKMVTVYVQGEVKKPGVYSLKSGSIVDDLVKAAGGFTDNASSDNKLNLAKKLKDEDYVFVERKLDVLSENSNSKIANVIKKETDKVNINSATVEELDKIPGIGPTTAQKIVDYREKNGQFNSIDELKKVGGIGDKTINKFRDNIDIR